MELAEREFHRVADHTLQGVLESIEAYLEEQGVDESDTEYGVRSQGACLMSAVDVDAIRAPGAKALPCPMPSSGCMGFRLQSVPKIGPTMLYILAASQ